MLAGSGVRRAIFIGRLAGRVADRPQAEALLDAARARLTAEGVPLLVIGPGDGFRPLAADLMNATQWLAASTPGGR